MPPPSQPFDMSRHIRIKPYSISDVSASKRPYRRERLGEFDILRRRGWLIAAIALATDLIADDLSGACVVSARLRVAGPCRKCSNDGSAQQPDLNKGNSAHLCALWPAMVVAG
jgi:hypothetical protein